MVVVILILLGIWWFRFVNAEKDVTARLVSIEPSVNSTGGNFDPFSNTYQSKLNLVNIDSNKEYSIYVCKEEWDWVEKGACYHFDYTEVKKNIESYLRSMALSGCYVGVLEKVDC